MNDKKNRGLFLKDEFPLVTVVIPTYNRPDLVKRAINSVKAQTYQKIEIIVIDDASEGDLLNELNKDSKVKFYRNNVNKGGCYSRNFGIAKATGQFINFLDDDDILYPDKIEKQINYFKQSKDNQLAMVTCHTIDQRSGVEIVKYNRVRGNIYEKLLSSFVVSGIETMLFKIEAIREAGGFDEKLQSSQEYDLLIRLSEKYNVDFVDEVLSKEFRSIDQISVNFEKKINGARYLFKKHNQRFKNISIVFWFKMQLKLRLLIIRFHIGKIFGEGLYRLLLKK